jgi:CDGSH-type Zn-finger protein
MQLEGHTMTEAVIVQKQPFAVELEAGTYWWCACGRSKNQPFCDGSHKGSEFTPQQIELQEAKKLWLCGCRRSGNKPHCDGTHKTL